MHAAAAQRLQFTDNVAAHLTQAEPGTKACIPFLTHFADLSSWEYGQKLLKAGQGGAVGRGPRGKLRGEQAEAIIRRQVTDFTCWCACLATHLLLSLFTLHT